MCFFTISCASYFASLPPVGCRSGALDRKALVGNLRHGRKFSVCVLHPGQPAATSSTHQGSSHTHSGLFALPLSKTDFGQHSISHPWQGARAVFATVILRLPPLSKRPGSSLPLPRTRCTEHCNGIERGTSICIAAWWCFHVPPAPSLLLPSPFPPLSRSSPSALRPPNSPFSSGHLRCAGWRTLANHPKLPTKNPPPGLLRLCFSLRLSAHFPTPTPAHFLSQPATRLDAVHHHLRAVRPAPSSSNLVPFNGSLGFYRLIADFVLHSSSALTP